MDLLLRGIRKMQGIQCFKKNTYILLLLAVISLLKSFLRNEVAKQSLADHSVGICQTML